MVDPDVSHCHIKTPKIGAGSDIVFIIIFGPVSTNAALISYTFFSCSNDQAK